MGDAGLHHDYRYGQACGLPSVTLLGEKSDLLERIEHLPKLSSETAQWYKRLKPVLTRFVGTFDSPGSPKTKDFWQNIVHYMTGGSGPAICLTGSLPFVFGMRMGIPSFILVAVNV